MGRSNIGVITLNLPMIYQKSKVKETNFFRELDYYLELIRKHHVKTFEMLSKKKASINPLMYTQGGIYGGTLNSDDNIGPVLRQSTTSFGYTALNELNILHNGKTIYEDGEFPEQVLAYIADRVEEFKHSDKILHSVYATPGETLCTLQVTQFKAKFGEVKGVTDHLYFTNSFHCHVSENITPIQKQDSEFRFWKYTPGGRIQYTRYPLDYNLDAIKTIVRRGMSMGFYQGVNLQLCYCEDCGYEHVEMIKCHKCNSDNVTIIDRNCGYLSFTKVKGNTRFHNGKIAEINDRVSM